jgi:hypothetical protein
MPDVAYYTNESFYRQADSTYEVAEVVRDEPGYTVVATHPTPQDARAHADRLNEQAGVAGNEVLTIVASSMAVTHRWQYGRFTGTKTCERCGLLPLDEDDRTTPCPGTRDQV